jgi:MoxR-like ATPase
MNAKKLPETAAERHQSRFNAANWWIYQGTGRPIAEARLDELLPPPPPWRSFPVGPLPRDDTPPEDDGEMERRLGPVDRSAGHSVDPREIDMVNAALYLRRPLLVTGPPGTGKSTLAFQIARELKLGRVLRWHITSYTTTKSGLYSYDAIGRAQAVAAFQAAAAVPGTDIQIPPGDESLGDFVRLGPLGTAFLPARLPRVLLVDELDKSEADLPNDLLGIFEDGGFPIPELERVRSRAPEATVFTDDPDRQSVVVGGRVRCYSFPVVVITSNGERDFPPAFLRRCLQLTIQPPDAEKLAEMVVAQLGDVREDQRLELVREFLRVGGQTGALPADRLLDAMFLATSGAHDPTADSWPRLLDALWRQLTSAV